MHMIHYGTRVAVERKQYLLRSIAESIGTLLLVHVTYF